ARVAAHARRREGLLREARPRPRDVARPASGEISARQDAALRAIERARRRRPGGARRVPALAPGSAPRERRARPGERAPRLGDPRPGGRLRAKVRELPRPRLLPGSQEARLLEAPALREAPLRPGDRGPSRLLEDAPLDIF